MGTDVVVAPVETEMPVVLDPRVERGASFLDRRARGWSARVDLETLRLSGSCGCVLGQLFGGYGLGAVELFGDASYETTGPYGFSALSGREYDDLEQDWRLAILSRRSA